jgi:hypothetical protein
MRESKIKSVLKFVAGQLLRVGRVSIDGIATRYGLNGPGNESLWGKVFLPRPENPWSLPSLLHNGNWISSPGVKRPWNGVGQSVSSSAEVKERVELYFYYTCGTLWPVKRLNLHLPTLQRI